ncbi:hypothetical protein [Maricaulis salignorans]|uniref:Uncharacterized protein n=1 Tax=Maricaulis salignorans TaxID=144026 RepID=A0A1G9RQK8_9PROT|nr:hypothetical protein [Maricaulis salignorans]SDM25501.1 hypothetical protein SAMN04488568_107116 [Maricaulis salignorans]
MFGTRKLLTPLALALLASSGTQAQTAPAPNLLAVQQTRPAAEPASPDAPRSMTINWDQARADARRQGAANGAPVAAARLAPEMPRPSNREAAEVANTRLPVLVPNMAVLSASPPPAVLLFPRPDFYTLSISGDGLVIEVFGTRLAHAVAPDAVTARQLRATGPDALRVSATEYGQVADFNRYGAAYSVTLECDNPQSDPRCADDVLVRRLARSLVIAAGSPGEGG